MGAEDPAELVWARERAFHDALAREVDVETLRRDGDDRLDGVLLDLAGDVRGLDVLDAGCGQGDLTLHLLERGATVTALDVSPGMIDIVRRRAACIGERGSLIAVAAPLERSGLPDESFDLAVGKFILHHVDVRAAASELQRVLRPGGRALFIENSAENRLLAVARKRLAGRFGIPRLGTVDEHPLTTSEVDGLRATFGRVTTHHPVFEFLVLFDRQVLRFRHPRVSHLLRSMDDAVYRRAPRLRRFSYRVILELERD